MPDHEDSLDGKTVGGDAKADRAEQSFGDERTKGGDTKAQSVGDQSTFGDANVDDELFDDGMKLEDLSERYTEEGVLGKGGMGEVILATDTRLGRKVAIKRILGKAARSKTAVARFLTEAKSMAELSHPNIVQIYDYGRATDGPFLIMECVQGGSLLEKCKVGPMELDEAVSIFGQLCDGLAKAHAVGIIHRDIKPANVLMTEDGVPKLTDFGLAKDDTADTGMTMEGAVLGTLDFMPPEQRQAAELTDHRSDLWSLAATLYQMLTGKSPKVINIASLPPKLQSVVAKALEESKEDRFQSPMEMREAIVQAHSGKMDTSRSLDEGECPQCATLNPSHGNFCVECTTALQVDCLKCKMEIQIWNKGCGECGSLQAPLVEKALSALKAIHDQAERLLADLEFAGAVEKSQGVASETDSRLQQYTAWHEEFSTRLEASRTSEHARLAQLLQEALTHEQSYDYEAGLKTLQQITPPLKQTTVTGNKDTAERISKRLTTKQSRLKELEGIVRERVSKREIEGLLPIVNELLTLRPTRADVQKLRAKLEQRGAEMIEARDAAVNKVTQQLSEQQYAEAVATLNAVSNEVSSEQLEELKTKASDLLNQLNTLRDSIASAISGKQFQNLLPLVEQCLALKPKQNDLVKLKQDLIAREIQLDARNQQITSQVLTLMQQQQFDAALEMLGAITTPHQTSSTVELSQQVTAEKVAKTTALLDKGDWASVLDLDPNNSEGLRLRTAAEKATDIVAALVKGDWKALLALDPGHKDGLRLKADAVILARVLLTNTIGMTLKEIPAGTFIMGSPETEKYHQDDETQHKVTISKAFYMQTTEVTQGQWKAVMETEPWKGEDHVKEGPNYAASWVSWDDAVAFCKNLSEKEGKTYRLPTEAEWEYACRAGTQTTWHFGNKKNKLREYAWYGMGSWISSTRYARQVGGKTPNRFGLYDMHGNVFEWCHDYYEAGYYKQSPEQDPTGPATSAYRVLRGESWNGESRSSRSAARDRFGAAERGGTVGFRLVCELD